MTAGVAGVTEVFVSTSRGDAALLSRFLNAVAWEDIRMLCGSDDAARQPAEAVTRMRAELGRVAS